MTIDIISLFFFFECFKGHKESRWIRKNVAALYINLYITKRDKYEYIYIYIYIHIILVTRAVTECPNGMYEIHIVQFLALSLPFSPRIEQRQKKGSLHFKWFFAILALCTTLLPLFESFSNYCNRIIGWELNKI